MAALEKFVFEEEMVTLPQLVEILKNNCEGNQVLQMKMINEGAKFGNGQKEAGNLACEMVNYFVERVEAYNSRYGDLIFSPCIATFSWIVNIGKRIGASADGRMSKDPIAANMSPVLSRDVSGPHGGSEFLSEAVYGFSRVNSTRYPHPLHACGARRRHRCAVDSQTHS